MAQVHTPKSTFSMSHPKLVVAEDVATAQSVPSTNGDLPDDSRTAREDGMTLARRGSLVADDATATGYDVHRMRDRALLSAEEERQLMRRVDLRIMTICSLLFLMKNLDADNISNARIMNRETDRNIMTQLGMTSDQYNLLNVLYYVSYEADCIKH